MKRLSVLFATVALAVYAAADDVPRVCPACDHEVAYDEAFCHNCGGDLSSVPVPGASAAEPEPEPAPGAGALAGAVRADVAFSRDASRGAFAVLAALRNAAALLRFDPEAAPPAPRGDLLRRTEAFFASCSREVAECPVCHGRGTIDPKPPPRKPEAGKGTLEASIMDVPVRRKPYVCGLCGGHGKAPRVRDRARMLDAMRLGARDYRRAAEAAGREERAGLLVPAGWYESLSGADRARFDRTAPPDCAACAGTGTVPCRACGGFGSVLCPNVSFHVPPAPVALKADRGSRIEDYQYEHRTESPGARCPACGGAWNAPGAVPCRTCGGKGLAACPSCGGNGHGR